MKRNRGRPWERDEPKPVRGHVRSKAQFEAFIREHKQKMKLYRQQAAYYIVRMGYEPESWPETRETALDVVAGANRGQGG